MAYKTSATSAVDKLIANHCSVVKMFSHKREKTSDSTNRRKRKDDPCRDPRRGPLPHRVVAAQRLPGWLTAWLY